MSRAVPTVTILPTPLPTRLPTVTPIQNPQEVTLPAIALYGDYDEGTRIGLSPDSLRCAISGQSPDAVWVYLSCPAPTNNVWAKVGDVELSAQQRDSLAGSRVVSRAVPTVPRYSPEQHAAYAAFYDQLKEGIDISWSE